MSSTTNTWQVIGVAYANHAGAEDRVFYQNAARRYCYRYAGFGAETAQQCKANAYGDGYGHTYKGQLDGKTYSASEF